jgi:hypothetical protein
MSEALLDAKMAAAEAIAQKEKDFPLQGFPTTLFV